jgi:hypothetical protein
VILATWALWKLRNAWVFGNTREQLGAEVLARRVVDDFKVLLRVKVGGGVVLRNERS